MAKIRTIAVIGAGAVGQDIARLAAIGGYSTILEDIVPASLRRAGNEIRSALDQALSLRLITPSEAEAALARIQYASSLEDAARAADLIIEAVPDEFESKTEILTLLDKVARPATIFATTSISCRVTELAAATYRANQILGMRFSCLPNGTQQLWLLRGRETDEETIAVCTQVGHRLGREVLSVADVADLDAAQS